MILKTGKPSTSNFRNDDPCSYQNTIPPYAFFDCPAVGNFTVLGKEQAWVYFLWVLSTIWITIHIWMPKVKENNGCGVRT